MTANLRTVSRLWLAQLDLTGCAVLSLHDPGTPPPAAPGSTEHLVLQFHDAAPDSKLPQPEREHARIILDFLTRHLGRREVVVQCEAGAGRSQAVAAAALELGGADPFQALAKGTYNRTLYRLLREAMGKPLPPDPLVSVVCRVKYPDDRLELLYLSLRRQRWDNWELIAVTDGPASFGVRHMALTGIRLIETPEKKGLWGHPYRQQGIDAAQGEYLMLANDDNYFTPGCLEQLATALTKGADLALCDYANGYEGWSVYHPDPEAGYCDLCCFMVRTELARQVPWPGNEFTSDGVYVERLARLARKVAHVPKVLVVKN